MSSSVRPPATDQSADPIVRSIACCFDGRAQKYRRNFERNKYSSTSKLILQYLAEDKVTGHSVLELGCGVGAVILDLIRKGASSAVGIDISREMISAANALSELRGYSGKAHFIVGDASRLSLPPSDIVILDRVICCYPDAEGLLANSLASCLATYIISYPRDDGLWALVIPIFCFALNMVLKLAGFKPFFFLHNTDKLRDYVKLKGFREVLMRNSGPWSLLICNKA